MSVIARTGACCPTQNNPIVGSPIKGSVGAGGSNRPADVKLIQQFLNSLSPLEGGPDILLKEDSIVGPKTIGAITKYQKFAIGRSDGRVDVDGATIKALTGYLVDSPTIPYGRLGLSSPQAGGTPNTAKPPKVDGAKSIGEAIAAMKAMESSLSVLRWKLTRTTPAMRALINKHFATKFEKVTDTDIGLIQKVLAATHHYIARFNAFGKLPIENVVLYSSDPAGNTLAWTVRGGDKMSTKQVQIYVDNGVPTKNPGQSIWLTNLFDGQPKYEKYWTILHEFAHFVGPRDGYPGTIDDHAYAFEGHFPKLIKYQKLHNAESLSLFFLEYCIGTNDLIALPRLGSVKDHYAAFPKVTPDGNITTA